MAQLWIGTSGFSYQHWRGVFYPAGLEQRRWLEYYARHFDTVELNATFYRMQREETFRHWAAQVPPDFIFAVKLSRFITHLKRLHAVEDSLTRFLSGARQLGAHLGPILVQLPPQMSPDLPRLDDFLTQCDPALRWAVEFRHPGWLTPETFDLLAHHQVALCIHDMLDAHPQVVTAPFIYLRFHGSDQRYGGSYPDAVLHEWAERMRAWRRRGMDVYAYFNNDAQGYAVQNARTLRVFCGKSAGWEAEAA